MTDSVDDSPPDVEVVLSQLLGRSREYARDGDTDSLLTVLETIDNVAQTKVPDESLAERLRHGCTEIERLAESDPETANEYLRAMERLLE